MALLHLVWGALARIGKGGRSTDRAPVFEHVDGTLLDSGGFRVSDSIGLDGAPSMAFLDAMPPYARDVDQPSVRFG